MSTYFPEANVLIPMDHTAKESNTPVSKSILVRFEPLGIRADQMSEMAQEDK